jgi:hypothetical protein
MVPAIRQTVRVQTEGVLEVRAPELRSGQEAEVTIVIQEAASDTGEGKGDWRRFAGSIKGQDSRVGDNDAIDRDLAEDHLGGETGE